MNPSKTTVRRPPEPPSFREAALRLFASTICSSVQVRALASSPTAGLRARKARCHPLPPEARRRV